MERLDAIIAAVGAVVVIAALGVVGAQGKDAGYVVTFVANDMGIGEGNRAHMGEASFTDVYAFNVTDRSVSRLEVTARVDYLVSTSTGAPSMHASLVAPNGTAYELESSAMVGRQSSIELAFDVLVAAPPANLTVGAASEEEAESMAANQTSASPAVGQWRLEVSFASGVAPVNSVTSSWEGRMTGWAPRAGPAAPAK